VHANVTSIPKHLELTKRGDYFYMSIAGDGESLHFCRPGDEGGAEGTVLRGNWRRRAQQDNIETATFSKVIITPPAPAVSGAPTGTLYSTMETITVQSTDRRLAYSAPARFEAPNWLKDGSLVFNEGGICSECPKTGARIR
jgi:hypothetical protein